MLDKNGMRTKLLLNDGIGVEVLDPSNNSVCFYFYENFKNDDGIARAYRHFNHGEHLTFYSRTWARQSQFKEYMELYSEMCRQSDEANTAYAVDPENPLAANSFMDAYTRQLDYMLFLANRLTVWTGCTFSEARKQVLSQSVLYSAF